MLARAQLSLTRRLIGQYLMFGCASILVLSVSVLVVFPSLLQGDSEGEILTQVQQASDAVLAEYADNNGARVQSLLEQFGHEPWLAYCGVVSSEGVYSAHTKSRRIGQHCETIPPIRDGKIHRIERAHWNREDAGAAAESITVREYWIELKRDDREFGMLQLGVLAAARPGLWDGLLNYSPQAVICSLVILLVGGKRLHKATVECAAIERQLLQMTGKPSDSATLRRLPEIGPAAAGWNRLVEQTTSTRSAVGLEESLTRALGGMREQKAERVLNSLADGIAVTDKDRSITFSNQAFCTLLNTDEQGLRSGDVLQLLEKQGVTFGDDVPTQLRSESRPVVFEGRRGAEIAEGVLRIARSPFIGEDGQSGGHIWTIRDITQQKLADEMRTQFVNSATHELRTPLANIKAYAETLALNDITDLEDQKEFLNIINSEATRLARFVDELLNVSRMESGSLSLSRQLTDVGRMLNDAVQKVRPQMDVKQQSFETVIPRKLPEVEMDKDKITAAIVNLLGNAAKYTPEGGRVALHVTWENGELKIAVEDTGIGIAAEELPKLAGKFFRSEDPRVRDIPGSGLGLSLVQEVARLHGGNLSVHSELNKGSRFTLTIPTV